MKEILILLVSVNDGDLLGALGHDLGFEGSGKTLTCRNYL